MFVVSTGQLFYLAWYRYNCFYRLFASLYAASVLYCWWIGAQDAVELMHNVPAEPGIDIEQPGILNLPPIAEPVR